mgnify:CR=1 FL=1
MHLSCRGRLRVLQGLVLRGTFNPQSRFRASPHPLQVGRHAASHSYRAVVYTDLSVLLRDDFLKLVEVSE